MWTADTTLNSSTKLNTVTHFITFCSSMLHCIIISIGRIDCTSNCRYYVYSEVDFSVYQQKRKSVSISADLGEIGTIVPTIGPLFRANNRLDLCMAGHGGDMYRSKIATFSQSTCSGRPALDDAVGILPISGYRLMKKNY